MNKKIGFLEKETSTGGVESSSTNLSIVTGAVICVIATLTETSTQIISLFRVDFQAANWVAIATLCGAVLVGGGVAKVGRNIKFKANKDV